MKDLLKIKFISQYLGQEVVPFLNTDNDIKIIELTPSMLVQNIDDLHLMLTPLSLITNEDVIGVAKIYHPGNDRCKILQKNNLCFVVDVDSSSSTDYSLEIDLDFSRPYNYNYENSFHQRQYKSGLTDLSHIRVYQYLQSKGYALPWNNYSVEELINKEWIKYKYKTIFDVN